MSVIENPAGGPAYPQSTAIYWPDPQYPVGIGRRRVRRWIALYWLVWWRWWTAPTVWRDPSNGQQRRLAIARAMCTRPEMLCLDEPAAGPQTRWKPRRWSRIIRFRASSTASRCY
ncbi:ATP-binding cassette domain-containing protein [Klebsiella pneumoniae subsp. pneumoniae]|nr:ATP-binding cassette domain-containing protein [Klebsiella pneumoniae subsp. pneumoniae]